MIQLSQEELKTVIKEGITEAMNLNKACFTVAECARYSNIGEERIRELVAKKDTDFPFFRVGVKVLIPKDPFDRWLIKAAAEKIQI